MTGPEFALSILALMIAAVLYDMLRNPSQPVLKDEPQFLENGQRLIKKAVAHILPPKKKVCRAQLQTLVCLL